MRPAHCGSACATVGNRSCRMRNSSAIVWRRSVGTFARWSLSAASAILRASATPPGAAKRAVAARPGTLRWSHI